MRFFQTGPERTALALAGATGLALFSLLLIAGSAAPADVAIGAIAAADHSLLASLAFGGLIVNSGNLASLFIGFSGAFKEGFNSATSHHETLAMKAMSGTTEEKYGWLGKIPFLREWIGARIIQNLTVHDYTIKNRKFESTVGVPRDEIEDDRIGVYAPVFKELGLNARQHPDHLLFELIKAGFTALGYDGQPFFDTEHPVIQADSSEVSVSNTQAGALDPWFLLDLSRFIKPFIFQERIPYTFQRLDRDTDENVFMGDEFLYGIRARANAGYGLWQLAFGSKADLTKGNYRDARKAMMKFRGDNGQPLNIKPTHLVVSPENEEKALQILNAENDAAGASNVWSGTAELIVATQLG